MRESLARILSAAGFRIVASRSTVHELLGDSIALHRSNLLIIDVGDEPNVALEQIGLFKERHPTGRIAVIAHHYQLIDMISAFRAGANVHFGEVVTSDALIMALELVMLGDTILPPELLSFVNNPEDDRGSPLATLNHDGTWEVSRPTGMDDVPRLSYRETCVLRFLVEGASNKVIGRNIEAAEATVKVHVKAILRKIRARNRTQAAVWAMNNGSLIWTPQSLGHETPILLRASADTDDSASAVKR
jgi:two-component system nitrate/nitrite response regulator NarL